MNALSKAELTQILRADLDIERKSAIKLVEFFFDLIKASLVQGETVKLSGFGNFEVRKKQARPGRNPKTGEVATISARRVVLFKAGLKLKARVE